MSINKSRLDVTVPKLDNIGKCSVTIYQNRSGEDIFTIANIGDMRFYAAYDGHGRELGSPHNPFHVSLYLSNYLHHYIADCLEGADMNNDGDVKRRIINMFIQLDKEMYDNGGMFGSTCSVVMVSPQKIYQINLGDSRSVIFDSACNLVSETKDHEPRHEVDRIVRAGGQVSKDNRVNGILAMSRAFGDYELKKVRGTYSSYGPVSPMPDITITPHRNGLTFVLGTDGLFDGCDIVKMKEILRSSDLRSSSKRLADHARMNNGNDDLTVIVGYI